jgi:hypothetical protein
MPRPSLPGPVGPDYTKPGRALPSPPRTPARSQSALNSEAMTMSVADPKKATLEVTGFWHQPRFERARSFSRALVGFDSCCLLVCWLFLIP